ncbi:MAG TPA: M23 family metallopeptidase [Polyangia bacterium]
MVTGLVACGARTQVTAPGPVVAVAPVALMDAASPGDAAGGDADGEAPPLDGGLASAPAAAPASSPAPAVTELHLPWSAGETWFLTSGPHSGKRAALDFAPPHVNPRTGKIYEDACSRKRGDAYWVRAAADGHFSAVLRASCPCVQIEHDDGTTTNYFHLRRSSVKKLGFKVGDPVKAGQAIGHPSCEIGPKVCGTTHAPSGVHVHFHRTNAATGARLPADGMVISGWKVKAIGRERDGMMTKGGEVRETRGKLLGWDCSPTTAACGGKRNDLEGDLAPLPGEARLLSLDADKKRPARVPSGLAVARRDARP